MSHGKELEATVFAEQRVLLLREVGSVSELKALLTRFVLSLTNSLREQRCTLIGHIKGKLESDDGGALYFNTTSFDCEPNFRGDMCGKMLHFEIAINIIVYGISKDKVQWVYENALNESMS